MSGHAGWLLWEFHNFIKDYYGEFTSTRIELFQRTRKFLTCVESSSYMSWQPCTFSGDLWLSKFHYSPNNEQSSWITFASHRNMCEMVLTPLFTSNAIIFHDNKNILKGSLDQSRHLSSINGRFNFSTRWQSLPIKIRLENSEKLT